MAGTEDPDEIATEASVALAKLVDDGKEDGSWMKPGDVMRGYPGGINAFMEPPNGGIGIPTPWPKLTKALCGLQPGDLFLVAGRPSMGKSIVAMELAKHAATHGVGAAVFSLEMTREALVRRLISAEAGIDFQRLRTSAMSSEERRRAAEAAAHIAEIPLWINETGARTVSAITSSLRKRAVRDSVKLVVIDHLQLMKSAGRVESRHLELSEISHALKCWARKMGITVVLVSQLNRDCERANRLPQLADLKETGALEEDADVVLFVHRQEQYDREHPELHGLADFIIGKQRNGPIGKFRMSFQSQFQRFVEPV
jgi:replicative DNA helicase